MAFLRLNPMLRIVLSIISTACVIRAQINTACTSSMVSTFTPCLNYVTGSSARGSSPTQDCCNAMKSLMANGVNCGCLIVTGNVPVSVPFINRNLAISLPRICRTAVPVQCKASGDPLPAPGPALFGPSAAPTAHAPTGQEGSADEAESPAGIDVAPAEAASEPPEVRSDPRQEPGVRPVINPNSASPSGSIVTLSNVALICLGIIGFNFL